MHTYSVCYNNGILYVHVYLECRDVLLQCLTIGQYSMLLYPCSYSKTMDIRGNIYANSPYNNVRLCISQWGDEIDRMKYTILLR